MMLVRGQKITTPGGDLVRLKIDSGEECQDTSKRKLNYICNSKVQVMHEGHEVLEQTAGRLALAKKGVMFVDEIFWCSL